MKLRMRTTVGATVRTPSPFWKPLYAGLIVVIVLGVANATGPTANANHRQAAGDHQAKQHSAAADQKEAVCAQSSLEHTGHADFRENVRRKLYVDNQAEDWDLLANNKIFLDMPLVNNAVQPCSGFPNRAAIPIEVYMAHDPTNPPTAWNWVGGGSPCGKISCEDNRALVFNPVVGHNDYRDSFVWFVEEALYIQQSNGVHVWKNDEQRSYVVSHEFGHVLGLADGGGDGDTLCDQSIMHAGKKHKHTDNTYGGCTGAITVFWPRQLDRDTATNIANNN